MSDLFVIGLTGSIGMGKSTTAGLFAKAGIPVWDADAAVHRIYAKGGAAVEAIRSVCPDAIVDGAVDRTKLKDWIAVDAQALESLNAIVHPLVAADRSAFLQEIRQGNHDIALVDVPLLFETGGEVYVDATVVVTIPKAEQRKRVLERPGMTEEHLDRILARQMPDAEKRARADYVVETRSLEGAKSAVEAILKDIRSTRNA